MCFSESESDAELEPKANADFEPETQSAEVDKNIKK